MSTRLTACTFCHGHLTLTVGDELIVCPAHPELHSAEGLPSFSVAQVESGDITIGRQPLPVAARLALIGVASLALWGLIVLTVMNPAAGFLAACTAAVIVFALFYRDDQ